MYFPGLLPTHTGKIIYQHSIRLTLCLLFATVLSCATKQGTESAVSIDEGRADNPASAQVKVDWYSIPDAGLLSIEKIGNDALAFTLMVGQGERCTGETSGTARLQGDGAYRYGDADCSLTFRIKDSSTTIEESGDLCDHGAHCSFAGDYAKVVSETVSPANGDVMSWMRKNISDFSCVLEKQYGYSNEKYPCGNAVTVDYDPKKPTWNEGPEFPKEKIKALHPLVKDVTMQFEHGDLYLLTVELENKMILQDVQRMFSLPGSFENYSNKKYDNVMSLTFNDYTPDDNIAYSVNPVYVTSFTLTGFEHMGAGDIEMESGDESVIETSITYEYRETGDVFTLIDEGGPGPYEFTCTSIAEVSTSSALSSQGTSSYATASLTDMQESTAWAEGKDGLGVGEWIEFKLTDAYKKWGYTDKDFVSKAISGAFVIQTGYAKSPALWKKNSRPAKLKCYVNGEAISVIQLKDTPDFQLFSIFPTGGDHVLNEGDIIRFEIMEVVKGTSDEDACISEFHLEGSCG